MPWVRFTEPFDYPVKINVTQHYKPRAYLLTQACAEAAIAAGKGELTKKPTDRKSTKHGKTIYV